MRLRNKWIRFTALMMSVVLMLTGICFSFAEEESESAKPDFPTVLPEEAFEETIPADEEDADGQDENETPESEAEITVSVVEPEETNSSAEESELNLEEEPEEEAACSTETVEIIESDSVADESTDNSVKTEGSTEDLPDESDTEIAEEISEDVSEEMTDSSADSDSDDSQEDEETDDEQATDTDFEETEEAEIEETESAEPALSNLHQAINENGYAYALTYGAVSVYSDKTMKKLLYTAANGWNTWLVTACTENGAASVYCVDENEEMVHGYLKESLLDDNLLTDEDVYWMTTDYPYSPYARKNTAVGEMILFVVPGAWAEEDTESEETISEEIPSVPIEEEPDAPSGDLADEPIEITDPSEDNDASTSGDSSEDESASGDPTEDKDASEEETEQEFSDSDEPVDNSSEEINIIEEPDESPEDDFVNSDESPEEDFVNSDGGSEEESQDSSEEDQEVISEENPEESVEELPNNSEEDTAEETSEDITEEISEDEAESADPILPPHQPGDYVRVSTSTRVFSAVDETLLTTSFPEMLQGCFTRSAVVQIEAAEQDTLGNFWYLVRFLYGDTFTNGSAKWTATAALYILASEAEDTGETSLTLTDYAYTREQLTQRNRSGKMLLTATAMNGFTLKKISGSVGDFYAGQKNLYGSSGKDSDYAQLAKSASHGTIYATPHYLSGYPVYCLEHTLSGPGEGTGSVKTATGPYKVFSVSDYVNTDEGGGVNGVQFDNSTMHAIAWIVRHSYPFMALNRSDSDNNAWSRVAGQFAIREVIKELEGSQYVRDYWDMDSFYSFSGGAPAVYLTYARWLAENGIARAGITGKITAKGQSVSISGSKYIGTVTLTTDADLMRIPRSAGTITGNSGGSDSDYYYLKSGDTIQIASSSNKFSVTIESLPSSDEEASILIGVPSVSIQKVIIPVYGSTEIYRTRTLTFEVTYGAVTVTKKATDGTLLKGAVFELLSGTTAISSATTNASGVATFTNIAPGTYTLQEKTAPQGYQLSTASTQTVKVTAGVTTTATFTNAPITAKIRIEKTDSVTGKGLPGATFTVTRLTGPNSMTASDIGQVVATITTGNSGIAETGELPYGQYQIEETGVPEDYLNSHYTTTVWIQ